MADNRTILDTCDNADQSYFGCYLTPNMQPNQRLTYKYPPTSLTNFEATVAQCVDSNNLFSDYGDWVQFTPQNVEGHPFALITQKKPTRSPLLCRQGVLLRMQLRRRYRSRKSLHGPVGPVRISPKGGPHALP